jgi:adenylate cyclase, class 2
MLEVETKYRVADHAPTEARLREWGAALAADHAEEDHYLNAPDRDFARTDEALRLRRIGDRNFLTYKGPRRDTTTKTRTELEVPCPSGDDPAAAFLALFKHLGYRHTAVVKKRRRIYDLDRDGFRLHVCLDDVENVGRFVELEIVADESREAEALALLARTAAGLELKDGETRSYLEQLLGVTVPVRKPPTNSGPA